MIFGPIYHCLSARFCGLTLYSPHTASTAAVKQSWALVWQSGSHDVNVSIGAKDWWHPTTRHNSDFSSLHVVNTQNSFVYRWEGVTSIIFRNFHNTNKASKQNFSHVTRKYIALTKNWPNFLTITILLWKSPSYVLFIEARIQWKCKIRTKVSTFPQMSATRKPLAFQSFPRYNFCEHFVRSLEHFRRSKYSSATLVAASFDTFSILVLLVQKHEVYFVSSIRAPESGQSTH